MKKTILITAVLLAVLAILGIAGYAFAQTPNPFPGMGGMMNGGGMMGAYGSYGPVHTYMLDALAERLGLTSEQIQTRIENGETMWDIAREQGLSDDEVASLMQDAHNQAIEAAVAAGAITSEQAEWMNSHMQQMHGAGGAGGCHGAGRSTTAGPNL